MNNKIIILRDELKNNFLNNINSLLNIKIITLSELKKKYYFDYDKKALYFISKKYNVIYDVSKKYMESIYLINDKYHSKKVDFLRKIKDELIDNNLIEYNELFHEFLKNKDIVIYNIGKVDKFYINIFKELESVSNVEYINDENKSSKKKIYECNNKEEEISFVASEICKLIKNGIDINNIKLCNVNESYIYTIRNIFKMFNIPVELKYKENILGSLISQKFIEYYDKDISKTLDKIKTLINDEKDEYVYNKIINIVNDYYFIDNYEDIKDLIIEDISKIQIESKKYDNSVRIVNLEEIRDNDYCFLINFNEGSFPIKYKDEDYLSDKEKLKINVSTSSELNENETINIRNYIKGIKNLTVTYSKYSLKGEIFISSIYDEELFDNCEIKEDYSSSNMFNKIELLKLMDENRKFGSVNDKYRLLFNSYNNLKYLSYDNKYKGINPEVLNKYLNNQLTLSYTSINSYYQCAYRYYLSNILKIDKYEQTFETVVGNIFHEILSECFVEKYDYETAWNNKVEKYSNKYEFTKSDLFFLDILKDELVLIIDVIKNQLNYTQLKQSVYEKPILIEINKDLHIMFKGFVDKILYDEFDGEVVCAIIDYKTGNPHLNLDNVVYGLDMQLPIYAYLIKKSNIIKNVKIGGFYLQKILNNEMNLEKKKNLLKLQGYSNSDINILEKVDTSYNDSNIIKSMKTTNNGLSSNAKVISSEQIDMLNNIIDKNIKEAADNILNAKFDINPKEINGKNYGCEYCSYKDICYMKNDDIVSLQKPNSFLGG